MPRRKINSEDAPKRKGKRIELLRLTPKQLKFCEGILAGLNQTDAWLAAYDSAGRSRASAQVAASRLRNASMIALWLDAAMTETLEAHSCTYQDHLKELARLKAIAIRTGNVGAAVQAEQLRGKVAGHYVDQVDMNVNYDPIRTLAELAQTKPELAAELAKEHNIPWTPEHRTVN